MDRLKAAGRMTIHARHSPHSPTTRLSRTMSPLDPYHSPLAIRFPPTDPYNPLRCTPPTETRKALPSLRGAADSDDAVVQRSPPASVSVLASIRSSSRKGNTSQSTSSSSSPYVVHPNGFLFLLTCGVSRAYSSPQTTFSDAWRNI